MKTPLLILAGISLLSACNSDVKFIYSDEPQTISFNFNENKQGWQAAFSDYTADDPEMYELSSGVLTLPDDNTQSGFFLGGTNRSDDLFMYIKSHFEGLRPSTRYVVNIEMDIYANAGTDCMGIGGAPGESVYMKLGFAETEPEQVDYYLNVDKGNQSNDGTNAKVLDNIAVADISCDGSEFGYKAIASNADTEVEFTSNNDGTIWFFVGTDSGYEGRTELYYDNIKITVKPAP
ncbi:hypothetical protein QX776_01375 [Alteromonadaceae bacterium BrNp21-10]|nr:hypothetical protein [Alteromonadaceae bacterium BrNp21-10]